MEIGIIGAGNIGITLGKQWLKTGHIVYFGVRDASLSSRWDELSRNVIGDYKVVPVVQAVQAAEVILIAIPGNAVRSLLDAYKDNLDGKVIMDATNRIGQEEINSLPEIMQALPHARIYRAFNHLGWENFENPQLDGIQIDLFYCGMPGESQQQVENLIADIGLRPVYVGGLEHAPTIDHLIRL